MSQTPLTLLAGGAFPQLVGENWEDVLKHMGETLQSLGHARPTFAQALLDRERRYPTGLPTPIPSAIPHADPEHVITAGVAVATLAEPVSFRVMGGGDESLDVRVVVMLCMTDGSAQVGALQSVLKRLRSEVTVTELLDAGLRADFEDFAREWLATT